MTDHQHSVSYPDRARYGRVSVDENVRLARDTYRVRFRCGEIASVAVPGQFVMLRVAECDDPLLGRPLAIYTVVRDSAGRPWGLDIAYLVVGKMTTRLAAARPGDPWEIWGPLGNGFPQIQTEHLVLVAGGIGQTPLLPLARESLGLETYADRPRNSPGAKKVTLCYGARNGDYHAGVEDFQRAGVEVRLSSDDGSAGHHGFVTDLIRPAVKESPLAAHLVCCGPEPMMEATAAIARELGLSCHVSLERPMACGIGICFSCVARVREASGGWDYRRTCVEGPVFDAAEIEF